MMPGSHLLPGKALASMKAKHLRTDMPATAGDPLYNDSDPEIR